MQNGRGHSVLDIGCGKGFVLNFFATMCFNEISGIEFDKTLCLKARKNLSRNIRRVKVYNVDAIDFPKYEEYDTFYMYNPFDENILEKVIDLITASYETNPRQITIIYCNPIYKDVLINKGFKETTKFYYKTYIYNYYRE